MMRRRMRMRMRIMTTTTTTTMTMTTTTTTKMMMTMLIINDIVEVHGVLSYYANMVIFLPDFCVGGTITKCNGLLESAVG